MSNEANGEISKPVSKIVSLKTGKSIVYEPETTENVEENVEEPENKENPEIANALNIMSEMNKTGNIKSIAIIGWDESTKSWQRAIIMPMKDIANEAIKLNGAFDLFKQDMMHIVSAYSNYFEQSE